MTILVYLWLSFFHPPSQAEVSAFVSTAPQYLTQETAEQHLLAARTASLVYSVDYSVLLSIAYHESRYNPSTITPEPGERKSCGVMTPVPKRSCSTWELTILSGYTSGAEHLAVWRSLLPGLELYAYAGGGWLAGLCLHDHKAPQCAVVDAFKGRALWIWTSLKKAGA